MLIIYHYDSFANTFSNFFHKNESKKVISFNNVAFLSKNTLVNFFIDKVLLNNFYYETLKKKIYKKKCLPFFGHSVCLWMKTMIRDKKCFIIKDKIFTIPQLINFTYLSIYLSIYLCFILPMNLSTYLSIYLCIYLYIVIFPNIHLFNHLDTYLYIIYFYLLSIYNSS